MPLTNGDWTQILEAIRRYSRTGPSVISSKVIRTDEARRVVWVEDFRETEVAVCGFEYEQTDTITPSGGSPYTRQTKLAPVMPVVGQPVLIVLPRGSNKAPKCIGVDLRRGIRHAV